MISKLNFRSSFFLKFLTIAVILIEVKSCKLSYQDSVSFLVVYRTDIDRGPLLKQSNLNLLNDRLCQTQASVFVDALEFVSTKSNEYRHFGSCASEHEKNSSTFLIVRLSFEQTENCIGLACQPMLLRQLMIQNVSEQIGAHLGIDVSPCSITTFGPCQGGLYPNDEKCVSYQYGSDPIQVIDCHLPKSPFASLVVLLVHGGFWRSEFNRSLEDAVGNDLLRFKIVVCNLDYRSVGNGGVYPNSFYDVANGSDLLQVVAHEQGFKSDRVIIVGHSAGGQLGGYITGRYKLRPNQPGYSKTPLRPIALVTQAGVNNMWDACDQANITGNGAAILFLGGTYHLYPERYHLSSVAASSNISVQEMYPSQFLPLQVPILAITGSLDVTVPISQTINFAQQSISTGDNCSLVVIDGEDHFVHLNVSSKSWKQTLRFILSFMT